MTAEPTLLLDGRGTLNEQIRRSIAAPILSGAWPPGARIPSEHDLMRLFGASRMTVNRALSALAAHGLIVRRRRSGSFVAVPADDHAVMTIGNIREELEAKGHAYGYERLSRRLGKAGAALAGRFGVAAGTPVVHLVCRHLADGRPAAFETRWINVAAVPEVAAERFETEPPGPWLLARVPWSEAEHVVAAINADAALAARLAVEPGAACLAIERRTWQAATPVTLVDLYYPGASHQLSGRFTATGQPSAQPLTGRAGA